MKQVTVAKYWLIRERDGKRYRSAWKMDAETAAGYKHDGPVAGTEELQDRLETAEERLRVMIISMNPRYDRPKN